MHKNSQAIYDARTLGRPKMLLLGVQHLFAMFGATILVPILVNNYFHGEGLSVQTTLFFAGVGTLLFHVFSRFKVPAFLGSSFAFLGGFSAIAEMDTGIFADMTYGEKLPYACGGIVVAGLLYLVLALLVKLLGVKRVMAFLPPQVTAPIVICIGVGLMPSAVQNCTANWPLALTAIVAIAVFMMLPMFAQEHNRKQGRPNQPLSERVRFLSLLPILLAVVVAYVVAIVMQAAGATNADGSSIINTAALAAAPVVGLPQLIVAKFNFSAIMVMAPIAISTMMEHIGDMNAICKETGEDFISDPGLHRTLIGDGLATALAGMFGGPANTTYGENTGVLTLTKVYDPRPIRIAAGLAVLFGFLPKVAELFGTMPTAIVGGISFVLYGNISVIGFRNIKENDVDLKKPRDLFLVSMIFTTFIGIRFYAGDPTTFLRGDGYLTIPLQNGEVLQLTALAVASILGILINLILPGKTYEYGANPEGDMNRGFSFAQTKAE